MNLPNLDTQGVRLESGKHEGELLTRVPPGYLTWMLRTSHPLALYARSELARRGTPKIDAIDVTAHAVDRASTRRFQAFLDDHNDHEGLYSWLLRVGAEAVAKPSRTKDGGITTVHRHKGLTWVFTRDMLIPILKTVI